jgi:hypothetical protein
VSRKKIESALQQLFFLLEVAVAFDQSVQIGVPEDFKIKTSEILR